MLDTQDYAGSHRPLLVFASDLNNQGLAEQRRLLDGHFTGLRERDMVLIEVVDGRVTVDGRPVEADAASLYKRYGVEPGTPFAVRLVGKDTTVKLSEAEPVTAERLFKLIDAMPMRQREMGR